MSHIKRLLVGLAVTTLAGCGSYGGGDEGEEAAIFAAAVDGSDAFIGVVVDEADNRVLAYVSDGKSVSTWFTGKAGDDGTISLTSGDGARLSGRIAHDQLAGSLMLSGGGAALAFTAPAVQTPAGLYRSKTQLRGESAVAGWVVLEDGRQRGAVRTTTGFTSWEPDLARPDNPVTGFTLNDTDI